MVPCKIRGNSMRKVDFEKITLTDDIMFSTVLSDPEKCKEFLQRLLGITIIELEIVTEQKSVKNKRVAKGIGKKDRNVEAFA